MPSDLAMTELIEDKYVTVKEELEEIIEEVKNDVDEKAIQIKDNKRLQEQSFEQLQTAMAKLRKDLKQLGSLNDIEMSVCFVHERTVRARYPMLISHLVKYLEVSDICFSVKHLHFIKECIGKIKGKLVPDRLSPAARIQELIRSCCKNHCSME